MTRSAKIVIWSMVFAALALGLSAVGHCTPTCTQLAQVTLYLAEQGSVAHPELEEPVRRARAAQDELNALDDEIARLMKEKKRTS